MQVVLWQVHAIKAHAKPNDDVLLFSKVSYTIEKSLQINKLPLIPIILSDSKEEQCTRKKIVASVIYNPTYPTVSISYVFWF